MKNYAQGETEKALVSATVLFDWQLLWILLVTRNVGLYTDRSATLQDWKLVFFTCRVLWQKYFSLTDEAANINTEEATICSLIWIVVFLRELWSSEYGTMVEWLCCSSGLDSMLGPWKFSNNLFLLSAFNRPRVHSASNSNRHQGISWVKLRPARKADSCALPVVTNVRVRNRGLIYHPPLSLHDFVRESCCNDRKVIGKGTPLRPEQKLLRCHFVTRTEHVHWQFCDQPPSRMDSPDTTFWNAINWILRKVPTISSCTIYSFVTRSWLLLPRTWYWSEPAVFKLQPLVKCVTYT